MDANKKKKVTLLKNVFSGKLTKSELINLIDEIDKPKIHIYFVDKNEAENIFTVEEINLNYNDSASNIVRKFSPEEFESFKAEQPKNKVILYWYEQKQYS